MRLSRRPVGLAHEDVEVVHRGGATQIEGVLALADIARIASLPLADVGQGVLYGGALAELGAPGRRLLAVAQFLEQSLIRVDRDAAAVAAAGTARAHGAGGTGGGGELDGSAEVERRADRIRAAEHTIPAPSMATVSGSAL
jgi:hypothetical protein